LKTGQTQLDSCDNRIDEVIKILEQLFVLLPKMGSGVRPAFLRKTCDKISIELSQLKSETKTPENP
jgi:hypothetical protein